VRRAPSEAPSVAQLAVASSVVAVAATARGWARGTSVCVRHAGAWPRLLLQASTGAGPASARAVLRDEVLGLWRDLALVSWEESRRAIDALDASTRTAAGEARPRRRYRVKP